MIRRIGHEVFVVDDQPGIASSLVAILALHGYCATAFTSPLKALEAARLRPPDIIISDVDMPDLNGIDLAILMAEHFPRVKVLLFSGQNAAAGLLENAAQKGNHFRLLRKPVHPSVILDEVARMSSDVQQLPFTA